MNKLLALVSLAVACTGATGPAGTDGLNVLPSTGKATDAQCPAGGNVISFGVDDDRDDTLQAGEIDQPIRVCNGVKGETGDKG